MFNYLLILHIFSFIPFSLPQMPAMSVVQNIFCLYDVSEFYELGNRNIIAFSCDITLVRAGRIIGTGDEGRLFQINKE